MSERTRPAAGPDFSISQSENPHECPGLDEHLEYVRNNDPTPQPVRRVPPPYVPTPLSSWKRAPLRDQQTMLYGVQADKKCQATTPSDIIDAKPNIDL